MGKRDKEDAIIDPADRAKLRLAIAAVLMHARWTKTAGTVNSFESDASSSLQGAEALIKAAETFV